MPEESTKEFGDNKAKAIELVDQLRKGKRIHDEFAEAFRKQYQVAGKLMSEWKKHFRMRLSPDLNPQTCQEADGKLMDLHQEAAFLKAEAEARLTACKSANDDRYRTKYTKLVAEYKEKGQKLPAKDTLGALAEHAISDTKGAQTHAEIELSFWKEVLTDLANCRRLVENATINLSVEAKALNNAKFLDRLGQKE